MLKSFKSGLKKNASKITALLLGIVIILSSATALFCLAEPAAQTNVISGRLPEVFGSADDGIFELNSYKMRYASSGIENMEYGYSFSDVSTKAFWAEKLVLLTDGDDTSGQYLRPQNSINSDRVIIIYRFAKSNITGFSLSLDHTGVKRKTFNVYLSEKYETLFTSGAVYSIEKERDKVFTKNFDSAITCLYAAVVLDAPDFTVNEITLTGVFEEMGEDIAAGMVPSMYAGAKSNGFESSGNNVYYGKNTDEKNVGYSEDENTSAAFWGDYTKYLTDGKDNTSLYIKPEIEKDDRRVVIVYTFSEVYDLSGFSFSFGEGDKNFSVYASNVRSELFEGGAVSNVVKFGGDEYNDEFDPLRIRFVGIVLNAPDYEITGISLYGTLFVPAEKGPNVIENAIPVVYCSTDSNKYEFNWSKTYYNETEKNHGYDTKNGLDRKDFWEEYVAKVTDGNENTSLYVKPERTWSSDNVLIVFELDDTIVNGFTVKTDSQSYKTLEIFTSPSISSLFNNRIMKAETADAVITDDGTIEVRARYVGICLKNPAYSVSEIEINGVPYVRPDYGTNLLEGKMPQRLFLADRSYPLIPNGNELVNIWGTNSTLINATDGDFKTGVNWSPTKAKSAVNKDTRYMVLSYDLGDNCVIDKVFLDSSLAGFDIYVSDNFDDLFESFDNRVYTSDGDKLKSDGSDLDPSTDLQPGELLIDLGGVSGRYFGIVITRAGALGTSCYEIVSISELQVFGTKTGTNYGDSLLSGKSPIMCYRAKYTDFSVSAGNLTSNHDFNRYTDGDIETDAQIQFPNNGGYINYDYGALVMIYYLEGPSTINYFNAESVFYYGIGGVDVYTASSFADLFKSENLVYTTGGTTADDGIYEKQNNVASRSISNYFDTPASGRYAAFVFTRVSDSNVQGWGIFRLAELTVLGKKLQNEVLPNTTLKDASTGSTASFEYSNPDEKFVFAKKGFKTLKINYVDAKNYATDTFKYFLNSNGYETVGNAFKIDFYDSAGKLISKDRLEGETVVLKLNLATKEKGPLVLAKLYDGIPYIIKSAVRIDNVINLTIDEFGDTYVLLKYGGSTDFKENLSDGSVITLTEPDSYDDSDFYFDDSDSLDIYDDDDLILDDVEDDSSSVNNEKKWTVVTTTDPLQWFWDTYDTFAANIWMPVVCVLSFFILIGSIVFGIIFYRKRRTKK